MKFLRGNPELCLIGPARCVCPLGEAASQELRTRVRVERKPE